MDTESIGVRIEAITSGLGTGLRSAKDLIGGFADGMKSELHKMSEESKQSMKSYESSFEQLGNVMKDRLRGITGVVEGVKVAWAQLAVVGEAANLMREAVMETVKITVAAEKMGRAMGISATQASVLNIAIEDIHGSQEEFIAMARGMDRGIRSNEEAMNAAGLATRDANGNLKDQTTLIMDGIALLRQHAEGTDRNTLAQTLFGKGFQMTTEMINLNQEAMDAAQKKAEEFGLTISKDDVAATDSFRAAMQDLSDMFDGVKLAVGRELMPIFTLMAQWMEGNGSTAILLISTTLATLATVIQGIALLVNLLVDTFKLGFGLMGDYVNAFGKVWDQLSEGNFAGAAKASRAMFSDMADTAKASFDEMLDDATKAGSAVSDMWAAIAKGPSTEAAPVDNHATKKNDTLTDKLAAAAEEAAKKAEQERKAELAAQKKLNDDEFRAFSEEKAAELEVTRKTFDDRLRIANDVLNEAEKLYGKDSDQYRKAALTIIKIEQDKARELLRIQDTQEKAAQDHAVAQIELAADEADQEVSIGAMSQGRRLELERQFDEQVYQIRRAALMDKLLLMDIETDAYAKMVAQIEAMDDEHYRNTLKLDRQAAQIKMDDFDKMLGSMENGWAGTLSQLLTFQISFKTAWQQILKSMLTSFTTFLQQKLTASTLFAHLTIAIEKMVAAVLRLLGFKSAADAMSAKASATAANIGQSAAAAGAGAAESQAAIPIIGPGLAIAAMAMIFAAVIAMKGKAGGGSLPSAEGGWDIPAGLNPLAQLHEKEMVLPKEQAEQIRNMSGSGQAINISVNALDSKDVRRFLMDNKRALADSIKAALRDGMR